MVINEDGVITENQNTEVKKQTTNENLKKINLPNDSFDLESNNQVLTNLENKETVKKNVDVANLVDSDFPKETVNTENAELSENAESSNSTENLKTIEGKDSEKKETG